MGDERQNPLRGSSEGRLQEIGVQILGQSDDFAVTKFEHVTIPVFVRFAVAGDVRSARLDDDDVAFGDDAGSVRPQRRFHDAQQGPDQFSLRGTH